MFGYRLSIEEEDTFLKGLQAETDRINQYRQTATPDLATRVGQIYSQAPWLPAGVALSMAKANYNDQQLEQAIKQIALEVEKNPDLYNNTADPEKEEKKSKGIFGWVKDKVKTASRWTMSALNFPLEMVQGAGSQFFDNREGVKGWFASTSLGTMIMEDEKSGNGFFLGGEALQNQGRRAREYRGEIGGHAWTFGRGLASLVATPDSKAFNLMSGIVDAGVAVAVPTIPGSKFVKGQVRGAVEAGTAGAAVTKADDVIRFWGREGARILPSNMSAEDFRLQQLNHGISGSQVNVEDANRWLGTAEARRLIDRTVEADTMDDVRMLYGDNLYVETAQQLRNAKTADEVQDVLINTLGKETALSSTKMRGATRFQTRIRVVDTLNNLFGERYTRLLTYRPGQYVDLSPTDPVGTRKTLNDIDRWMKQSLVDDETRRSILDEATDALVGDAATPTAQKALREKLVDTMKKSLVDRGIKEEVVDAVFDAHDKFINEVTSFNVDDAGNVTDNGMYMGLAGLGDQVQNGIAAGPQLASEMARSMLLLPDPDQVRRLSGLKALNKIFTVSDSNLDNLAQAGQLRMPFATVQFIQDKVWRSLILMTGGYGLRNLLEGQVSLALSGKDATSVFRHPLQHLMWSTKTKRRRGVGDVFGEVFDEESGLATMREFQKASGNALRSHYSDPADMFRRGKRVGQWRTVKNSDGLPVMAQAHGDELGLLNADFVARRYAQGATREEIVDELNGVVNQGYVQRQLAAGKTQAQIDDEIGRNIEEGRVWLRDQLDYHDNGRSIFDPATNSYHTQPIDLRDQNNLALLLDSIEARFVRATNQRSRQLVDIVAGGRMPDEIIDATVLGRGAKVGDVVEIPTATGRGTRQARVVSIDPATNEAVVAPFAFQNREASSTLDNFLQGDTVRLDPKAPQELTWEVRAKETATDPTILQRWDQTTDTIFSFLHTKPAKYLERSPAFRQRYYSWIGDLAPSLDESSVNLLVQNVRAAAQRTGTDEWRWVGSKETWDKIVDLQANPQKLAGSLTLRDADFYAKGNALDDLKSMLYDASERNNITDIARVVMPFAQAQVEFFRRFAGHYVTNTGFGPLPNLKNIRKTQLVVEGGREADPDGDGRGFFYTDPVTGEWMFSYPMSHYLTRALTSIGGGAGLDVGLSAPVKGFAIGLDYRPGLGPFAQVAASKILPDSPKYDEIRSFLLPYGETDFKGSSFEPAWFKKLRSALTDDPDSNTVFGNTFMETYQALIATGEYDTTNPDEMEQLYQDSIGKAKTLTILRGLGQFTGPSRPVPQFTIPTEEGDVYVKELSKAFYDFRQEDYDTAVPRFLDAFGEDAFIYMAGKSRSVYGGIQSSAAFGEWERQGDNSRFLERFKNVGGYFADTGSDFDFQVYQRNLITGRIERITAEESKALAEKIVATSYYRSVQRQVGSYPNEAQRQYLREYRAVLSERFPGFGAAASFDTGKFANTIAELRTAVDDSAVADTDIAGAIRNYLDVRDQVIGEAQRRGLVGITSKSTADLRDYLVSYATQLSKIVPNFSRIYDGLFAQEVETDV
jgi:hypothetical protein